jgi:poly-gamma-glutamate capsule biosynthesis protein CapA/YwtB (metallophosphatase superfamily)
VRDELAQAIQSPEDVVVLLAGDLVLDAEDPDHWLAGIAPAVASADLAVGHLEVPHTLRGAELEADVPASAPPPDHLDALARAGFSLLTLAGNHIADRGAEGISDTITRLDELGIAHTGAGATQELARLPTSVECRGRRVSVLSYNCVGPEASWATSDRAGCNYLEILTADGGPVSPSAELTEPADSAIERLRVDVAVARGASDLLIVALHKGIVHTPVVLAPYERPLADAALAAGADVVVSHHAHILRGIEIRDGRPVFHGLGNGCVVTRALDPAQDHPARAAWSRRRRELFGFEPDPRYTLAPFHREAVHGVLGLVILRADGSLATGLVPMHVEPPGRPVCVTDQRAESVIDYVTTISSKAALQPCDWVRRSPHVWMAA